MRDQEAVSSGSSTGVWANPHFHRSRAVECLRIALETGDTTSFMTATHHEHGGASGEFVGKEKDAGASSRSLPRTLSEEFTLSNGMPLPQLHSVGRDGR